jgi:hypothetical protein
VNAEDDPEARIRALEQPLSDQARASELGGGRAGGDAAYLPPPTAPYSPPDYSTPAYGSAPYGAQPFGTQPYGAPPTKISGGIPWLVFGVIAVVFIAIGAGAIIAMKMTAVSTPDDSRVSSGGGSIDISIPAGPSVEIPSVEVPNVPSVPTIPTPVLPNNEPSVTIGAPGQTLSVSGIDEIKMVECNDATVAISGIRNTVTITGHCLEVSVSGFENIITVDAADSIGTSGFDNKVTYHSGSPQIDATDGNTVQQG